MKNFKNLTEVELVLNENLRKDVLNEIGSNLRNSEIWNIGTKFETVFGNYMTKKQVAKLFDLKLNEKGDCKTIEYYFNKANNGKENEYLKELTDAGVRNFSKDELTKMKEKYLSTNKTLFPNETRDSELIENNGVLESDTTDEFVIPSKGCKLFSLEAVCKLGMFMTKTPKAIEFRNRIVDNLKLEVAKTEDIKIVVDSGFKNLKSTLLEKRIPSIESFGNYIQASMNAAKKINYSYYKATNKELKELKEISENLLQELKDEDIKEFSRIQKEIHNKKIDDCKFLIMVMDNEIISNDEQLERIMMQTLNDIGTKIDINLSSILSERGISITPSIVNSYKEKLVDKGIFKKVNPVSRNNKYALDKNGNKILIRKKGDIITDKFNYIPTEKYNWLNTGKYAKITEDGSSQKFEFSNCGKIFLTNILFNDKVFETEEEFIIYLLDRN